MSMLDEIWTCGLSYKDCPVKLGSALERTLCLYTKNQNKLKAMLSEEQAEQYQKTIRLQSLRALQGHPQKTRHRLPASDQRSPLGEQILPPRPGRKTHP